MVRTSTCVLVTEMELEPYVLMFSQGSGAECNGTASSMTISKPAFSSMVPECSLTYQREGQTVMLKIIRRK